MKINYSSRVAHDAVRYAAFVETVDAEVQGLAKLIRVTSTVFGDIMRLFEEFAPERELGHDPKIKDLYEEIQECSLEFDNIIGDIYSVARKRPSPSKGRVTRKKVRVMANAQRFLEVRIRDTKELIQVYQWRLSIQYQTFSIRLSNR